MAAVAGSAEASVVDRTHVSHVLVNPGLHLTNWDAGQDAGPRIRSTDGRRAQSSLASATQPMTVSRRARIIAGHWQTRDRGHTMTLTPEIARNAAATTRVLVRG
jgi:hypothetical protein